MSVLRRLKRTARRHEIPDVTGTSPEAAPTRRINQYTCSTCGGVITTIDRAAGVTPMFLNCRATPECDGRMHTSMYKVDANLMPDYEWYRPTGKVKPIEREYVNSGGLLLRPIEVQQ